jgi:hypothetical protein
MSVAEGCDVSENLFPAANPTGERAARQLAAMRLLFDAERERHESDVLLATLFETLSDERERTTDELLQQVQVDWPGIVIPRSRLESTLEVAAERGFLRSTTRLSGVATWAIADLAAVGVKDSQTWAREVLQRCAAQVEERARESGQKVDGEQAEHWTNLLLEVLHEGMIGTFSHSPGQMREVSKRLFPPYDREKIIGGVKARVDDPVQAEFLSTLALAALDPGSTFGTEVVHYLATGYVLYAILVGLDLTTELDQVADFRGEVLLLDTPVLLRLLSGGREFQWTSDLVGRIASLAGATVALTTRTRQEFSDMLERRNDDAGRLEAEMADGTPRRNLAAAPPDDEVLTIWLRDPAAPTWAEFTMAAGGLFTTLGAIGVAVDYQPDAYEGDVARRRAIAAVVQEVTAEHRGKPRHPIPADHDGEMLCLVSHLRNAAAETRDSDSIWPGAFVVTTDRSLNAVYKKVEGDDVPVALSIGQAASLLARLAQPADAEKLAELIANDLQWQARFKRGVAFGVDQAIELARSFTSQDPEALAVEAAAAELTFEEVLTSVDGGGDPTAAARAAVVRRAQHLSAAADDHRAALEEGRAQESRRAFKAEAEVQAWKEVSTTQAGQLTQAQRDAADKLLEASDLEADNTRLRRVIVVLVLYAIVAGILLALVAVGVLRWGDLVLPGLAMAGAGKWFYDWTRKPEETYWGVLWAVVGWASLVAFTRVFFN